MFTIKDNLEAMNYYERFISAAERHIVTHELASLGEEALPILKSLFNGSAKNKFGVPYKNIGANDCGFITVQLLGPTAKSLEKYVKSGIEQDHPYAISAAGYLLKIEEETALALANALVRNPASEAGASLIMSGKSENDGVLKIINANLVAVKSIERTRKYMSKT